MVVLASPIQLVTGLGEEGLSPPGLSRTPTSGLEVFWTALGAPGPASRSQPSARDTPACAYAVRVGVSNTWYGSPLEGRHISNNLASPWSVAGRSNAGHHYKIHIRSSVRAGAVKRMGRGRGYHSAGPYTRPLPIRFTAHSPIWTRPRRRSHPLGWSCPA